MQRICIVGPGRVAGALALALSGKGKQVSAIIERRTGTGAALAQHLPNSPFISNLDDVPAIDCDAILFTTGDGEIRSAAEKLSRVLDGVPVALHTSGSLSSDVLSSLSRGGTAVGSMHPLISISDPVSGSKKFEGAYFCIEGEDKAVEFAEEMVKILGGTAFSIPTEFKPLYHAAAVTAAGHLVALLSLSYEMLAKCGIDEQTASRLLVPLSASVLDNLRDRSPAAALTGSFARLDVEAFERHLSLLAENVSPKALEIYLLLGDRSLDLAGEAGGDPDLISEFRSRIKMAKTHIG